jgi:hypothetical protein
VPPHHPTLPALLEQHKGLQYSLARKVRDIHDGVAPSAQESGGNEYVALPPTFGGTGLPPPPAAASSPINLPVFAPYSGNSAPTDVPAPIVGAKLMVLLLSLSTLRHRCTHR